MQRCRPEAHYTAIKKSVSLILTRASHLTNINVPVLVVLKAQIYQYLETQWNRPNLVTTPVFMAYLLRRLTRESELKLALASIL
jgi:hypothetical protein